MAKKKTQTVTIYLSPANHHKNYANGSTEKTQMDKLAPLLKTELEKYKGVKVYNATIFAPTGQYDGRPEEALRLGVKYYVALHTNAMGMSATGGTATGACGFYHPAVAQSREIATAIVQELNAVCPIKSNRAMQPAVYQQGRDVNLGELRVPAKYGMCPVLIEHEFHDRLEGADWICNNLEAIARADAKGIAKALGLKGDPVIGDVNGDGEVDNMDALQILRYDAGLENLSAEQRKVADVNGDGRVDNLDVTAIFAKDAGKAKAKNDN